MAALAASQYGVVSRTQLTTVVGVSEAGVHRLVARGRLHPVYRGVYAVGHTALRREGRFIAAALASGPGTAVARRAAGAHWEIRPSDRAKVDVVTNRPGLAPHRQIDRRFSRHLGPQDVTVRIGDLTVKLPANLDRPGAIYELGTVTIPKTGGPRAMTFTIDDPAPPGLHSPMHVAYAGNVLATRAGLQIGRASCRERV